MVDIRDQEQYELPTFLELRLKTRLSRTKFAQRAGIAIKTQARMETGKGISALTAQKSLDLLNELLGTSYKLIDFKDVNVKRL